MHAHTSGAIADHGLPPHQSHNAIAAAHTAGTGIVTTARTHARQNPTQAFFSHFMTSTVHHAAPADSGSSHTVPWGQTRTGAPAHSLTSSPHRTK
ncbi:hypothetical protein Lesp02_41470 [Lentzea sp. NBRC 105346]|nr:hypothetical protein Lesp02_41470 [Lentzea sp. NBRC 105346]